jgi:pimeloyl-ACP methyl ester carboxylesterase
MPPLQRREVNLHGHRVSYAEAGDSGPVVVLVHGIAGSSATWAAVAPGLAERGLHVIAPDLLGHGESAKPRGDYSLGAFASGVRDLLHFIDHERVTVVGHSLGGGVAMQFAYQFPEMLERLVLVDSGGLGREVTPLLRAATLPGSELVLPLLAHRRVAAVAAALGKQAARLHLPAHPSAAEVGRGFAALGDTRASRAFINTARSVIDLRGQRVSALDRLYLAADVPTMFVWGGRDSFIPVSHGRAAHAAVAGSRLEVFERSGHFPHCEEPERFTRVIDDFIRSTEPAQLEIATIRERLRARG